MMTRPKNEDLNNAIEFKSIKNRETLPADFKQHLDGTNAFLDLVLSTVLMAEMKDRYYPDTKNVFLAYPLGMTTDLMDKIARADIHNASRLHDAI